MAKSFVIKFQCSSPVHVIKFAGNAKTLNQNLLASKSEYSGKQIS